MTNETTRRDRGSSRSASQSSAMSASSAASPSYSSFCSSPSVTSEAGPSSHRITLDDIHIPAGFEIAKDLGQNYPAEESILKAADVLKSLRGRMPDGTDGQVAACDYCRRRKIRCDRIKPTCGSCVQTGRKCTTEDMLRKRGPPSKKERAVLEAAGIIFRGTRPHRRRRTATTSLGSGAAAAKQQELLSNATAAAPKRVRSHSSAVTSAATSSVGSGDTKSSWMEMLSLASQTSNPFAESPVSSPSDLSPTDTHLHAGACDYLLPTIESDFVSLHHLGKQTDQWDSIWQSFKQSEARGSHCHPFSSAKPSASHPYASLESGALDWTNSPLSLQQYQALFPVTHIDTASSNLTSVQTMQRAQQQMLGSGAYAPEDAHAFQSAMAHFFPAAPEPPAPFELQQFSDSASPDSDPDVLHNTQSMPPMETMSPVHSLFTIDALSAF